MKFAKWMLFCGGIGLGVGVFGVVVGLKYGIRATIMWSAFTFLVGCYNSYRGWCRLSEYGENE